jgi:hypothetical protein
MASHTVVDRIVRREIFKAKEPGRINDARVWNATWPRARRSPGHRAP